jgi:2-(1,2-epoxy-1,2-dihydrophenyl)acetyl-CoA isomerase
MHCNAASPAMFDEIGEVLRKTEDVRAILLLASGLNFCLGTDLDASFVLGAEDGEPNEIALRNHYHPTLEALAASPVPVVSAVRGGAVGIGSSLALIANFCIASKTAYFHYPAIHAGLVASGGATWILQRLAGPARASEMLMLGERISVEKAGDWGLVYRIVEDSLLESEAWALALQLADPKETDDG